jgi:diguanylate cyclase (GGDEF)-like protein/PAS domain S-box-containing protein
MNRAMRFLIVEDLATDAELVEREVRKTFPKSEFRVVDCEESFLAALDAFRPDAILSDYSLPRFNGLSALKLAQEHVPETPFLLVTGSINEETAVACMKAGAWDYILKDHLRRLGGAIESALNQRRLRAENRRAAEELRESEERLRLALQATNLGLYDLNLQTGEAVVTPEYVRMLGYDPESFRESNIAVWRDRLHPDDREAVWQLYQECVEGKRDAYWVEYRHRRSDGGWVCILSIGKVVAHDAQGRPLRMLGTHTDISERKQAEAELLRLNRTLRVLSRCNETLVRATSEAELLDDICRNLVEIGGYPLAWVGFLGDDGVSIAPAAQIGEGAEGCPCLREHRIDPATSCPTAQAILGRRPSVDREDCGGLHPHLQPLREGLEVHAIIALPLLSGDEVLGALTIFSHEEEAFDTEEIKLLTELADDLAFGIRGLRTVAARQAAEAALKLRTLAIEASSNGIAIADALQPERTITDVNPAFERITGYTRTEALGRELLFFDGTDGEALAREEIRAALRQRREGHGLLRCRRKNGSVFWCEVSVSPVLDTQGRISHFISVLTDVTDRKIYEEELERQANHDTLTGLANRNLLTDRLTQSTVYADRSERVVATLLFDLDRFKVINDSLGHVIGDELLCRVAKRLSDNIRAGDTVARLGGDEFVVALAEVADVDDVGLIAKKLLSTLAEPFDVAGRQMHISASVGISLYPRDGRDPGALLRCADIAMYQAKDEGGDAFRFFAPEMNQRAMETMELEADLRRAVEEQRLLLYFQPMLDFSSGRIVGAEALLRWPHPQRGMISPMLFIPLAEETGLILSIGEWVLRTVCARLKAWQELGLPPLTVALNLSARQFQKADLANSVHQALFESGVDAHWLELELTESMLMRQPAAAIETMLQLKMLGVSLALDDFGTGYSSLNYLRRFPVDSLKIDRSFISDVPGDTSATAVAASIVAIAHSLGMHAIAEGVETVEQLRFLQGCGCDRMQGFYFSRPLPEEEFVALLRSGKRLEIPAVPDASGRKGA